MARLLNAKVWYDHIDLSGVMNGISLEAPVEVLDSTTLSDSARRRTPGLEAPRIQVEGFSSGEENPDAILFARNTSVDIPITIGQNGTEGEVAYLFRSTSGLYTPISGAVGDLNRFSFAAAASQGPLVRGVIGARRNVGSSSGNTGGWELGAVSATQKLYASLHVLSASGADPQITVSVEGDTDSGFGSPFSPLSFALATSIDAQFVSVAGAFSETWWRVKWVIGGTTTDFDILVGIGIR